MNPGIIIALFLAGGTVGALFYSYHIGRSQGTQICEADRLQKELKAAQEDLKIQEQLSQFQQEQIGEAQIQFEQEKLTSDTLRKQLENIPSDFDGCISDSMRDAIIEYRKRKAKDKNS